MQTLEEVIKERDRYIQENKRLHKQLDDLRAILDPRSYWRYREASETHLPPATPKKE